MLLLFTLFSCESGSRVINISYYRDGDICFARIHSVVNIQSKEMWDYTYVPCDKIKGKKIINL